MILGKLIIASIIICTTVESLFNATEVLQYAIDKFSVLNEHIAKHVDLVKNHTERVKATSQFVKEAVRHITYRPKQNNIRDNCCSLTRQYLCGNQGMTDNSCDNEHLNENYQLGNGAIRRRRGFNSTGAIFFWAVMSGNEYSLSKHHLLHFDTVKFNQGQAYDKYIGTFIVPAAGTYAFTWSISVGSSSSYSICTNLIINDSVYGILYTDPYHTYEKDANFVVAHANKGDVVFIRTCTSTSSSGDILSSGDLYSSYFAGWLV